MYWLEGSTNRNIGQKIMKEESQRGKSHRKPAFILKVFYWIWWFSGLALFFIATKVSSVLSPGITQGGMSIGIYPPAYRATNFQCKNELRISDFNLKGKGFFWNLINIKNACYIIGIFEHFLFSRHWCPV